MNRDALKLTEAIAAGLFLLPMLWMLRAVVITWENPVSGLGDTGVPLRWAGLGAALALSLMITLLPRWHNRITFAIGLAVAGLVWGIGVNGPDWYMAPGKVWDIRVLWLYMTDALLVTNPRHDTWVSIAWVSAAGLLMALAGGLMTLVFLDIPLREMRKARRHRGTNRYRSKETVFGDANWSDWREIGKTVGDPEGIVLGEDYDPRKNPRIYDPLDKSTWGEGGKAELVTLDTGFAGGHSLVFAGTGSGKTAGIVYPTAFTYQHPIIFMDPQHEIYETVAKTRADMGFQARVIEIGHGVDLIGLLRPWLEQSAIAYMHLADSLVGKQDAMKSEYSQFYATEGANLVSGFLEYLVTSKQDKVFNALYKSMSLPEETFKKGILGLTTNMSVSESVRDRLASYAEMEGKNFSNLQTNVKQALNWAAFPEMCDMLDSEPKYAPDLLGSKTDVYIRLKISDLKSFPGIARAILGAILYHVNESQDGIERLMIVDEAYQVGRLQGFELIRDTMRKRGLHLMLIFQSIAQLEETYQKTGARAWNNSVAARVYAATDDNEDQTAISRMIGEYTVDVEGRSKSSGIRGYGIGTPSDNRTRNINLQKASLMRPEQIRTLEADGLIVFFKGENPLICGKALSFRRREWQHITPFRPRTSDEDTTGKGPGVGARIKGAFGKKGRNGPQSSGQNPSLSKLATPRKPNPRTHQRRKP